MERRNSQSKDRGSSRERGYGRGPQTMYKAKCSDCGEETEVPFKPDLTGRSTVGSVTQSANLKDINIFGIKPCCFILIDNL